jgi:hypothetical protein
MKLRSQRLIHTFIICWVVLFSYQSAYAEEPDDIRKSGKEIGTVGQEKVYQNQLDSTGNSPIIEELHQLFLVPTLEKYYEMHKESLKPTEEEVKTGIEFLVKFLADNKFEKQHPKLKSLFKLRIRIDELKKEFKKKDLSDSQKEDLKKQAKEVAQKYAKEVLKFTRYKIAQIKLQEHLYVQYGTGRILTQNGDEEAFDGAYRWLSDRERRNVFKITDPELKKKFYSYWTETDQWPKLRGIKNVMEKDAFPLATLGLPPLKNEGEKTIDDLDKDIPNFDIAGTWLRTDSKSGKQTIFKIETSDNKTYKLSGSESQDGEYIQKGYEFKHSISDKNKDQQLPKTVFRFVVLNKNLLMSITNTKTPGGTKAETDWLVRLDQKTVSRLAHQLRIRANLSVIPEADPASGKNELDYFQGKWILIFKRSGYLRMVEFRKINSNQIQLHGAGTLKGIFELNDAILEKVDINKNRPLHYTWMVINSNILILHKAPPVSSIGSDYTGNLLIRITDDLIEKLD